MSICGIHGRATVDPDAPEAFGTCQRCGFLYNLKDLVWQYDWRGNTLTNTQLLVCTQTSCLDEPFNHFRPIIIPPDPVAIIDARPGYMTAQEGPAPAPNYEQTLAQLID